MFILSMVLVALQPNDCGTWANQARMFGIAREQHIPIEVARQKNEEALQGALKSKRMVVRDEKDAQHARDLLEDAYSTDEEPNKLGQDEYDACTKKLGIAT